MATSGSFNTSGYSGGGYPDHYVFSWSLTSQSIESNCSVISWSLVGAGGSTSGRYTCVKQKYVTVNGSTQSNSDIVQTKNGTVAFSGSSTIYHDSAGNGSFSASAGGAFYTYGSYNSTGSGSWSLPQIPRQANLTSAPNFNDEENPTIGYSNLAGNSVTSLQACISLTGSSDDIGYRDISKTGTSYTFSLTEAERNVLRNACTTANSRTVKFYVRTIIGSSTFYSILDRTLTIVNGTPTFSASNVTYKDNNSTTVAVTGNNQKLVQNLSSLLVTITSATAKKGASITKYEATINGVTKTITSAGNINYGVINSGSNLTLTVKVTDSRGNTNSCNKTVTFLAWVLPTGIISLKRKNNYEDTTYLKVQSTYSSVDSKNTITIQYQFKKTSDSSYSSLTTLSNNTQVTLTKAKAYAWDFRIILTDKFGSTTYNTVLAKGQFILFVDTKKLSVGVNCFPKNNESLELNGEKLGALDFDKIYPIGSVYLTVTNDNPATLFGGTWVKMTGGYLYGCVSSIGNGNGTGTYTNSHTLTLSQIPSHNHSASSDSQGSHNHGYESQKKRWADTAISTAGSVLAGTSAQSKYAVYYYTDSAGSHSHNISVGSSGGGQGHSHNIPYIGVWVWKRTG